MKLDSPTIYCLHKVQGQWARSAFAFEGLVDRRRIKREIIRAFRRAGEVVHPEYVDASIDASLKAASRRQNQMLGQKVLSAALDTEQNMISIEEAERHLQAKAEAEEREYRASQTTH